MYICLPDTHRLPPHDGPLPAHDVAQRLHLGAEGAVSVGGDGCGWVGVGVGVWLGWYWYITYKRIYLKKKRGGGGGWRRHSIMHVESKSAYTLKNAPASNSFVPPPPSPSFPSSVAATESADATQTPTTHRPKKKVSTIHTVKQLIAAAVTPLPLLPLRRGSSHRVSGRHHRPHRVPHAPRGQKRAKDEVGGLALQVDACGWLVVVGGWWLWWCFFWGGGVVMCIYI